VHEAAQAVDLRFDDAQVLQGAPHVGQKQLARPGGAHAARQPLEQRRAQLSLQIQDALVQRGRRDV
jgi:hypothetical protein